MKRYTNFVILTTIAATLGFTGAALALTIQPAKAISDWPGLTPAQNATVQNATVQNATANSSAASSIVTQPLTGKVGESGGNKSTASKMWPVPVNSTRAK